MAAAPVLDSYALLVFLRGEPGEEKVTALLERAGERDQSLHMTEANYAEVKYITVRKDGTARWEEIARELRAFPIEFHPIDRALADLAADIKARHKLSLADAFAAALAKQRKCELVTGDMEFATIEKEIKIVWLT
jgi:ribonuclease VapC